MRAPLTSVLQRAFIGSLTADALAMPAHWYYNREALQADYGRVDTFRALKEPHPDSIFWRSRYEVTDPAGDILRDNARFWGNSSGVGVHYHRGLKPGENTLNFRLGIELYRQLIAAEGCYDAEDWLNRYVELMLDPEWNPEPYVEEVHRAFFKNRVAGKKLTACGIDDNHIGGLAAVPALLAGLGERDPSERRLLVREHISLTHTNTGVLQAADGLVRMLGKIEQDGSIREAIESQGSDWFSAAKAERWLKRPDLQVIGETLSPACYIRESFPAALYLAWKYHDQPREGLIANVMVGGDNCHRGAVVGALLGTHPGAEQAFKSFGGLSSCDP